MTPEERKKRDIILINRALETGDPAAYSELMRHYRDRLYFMIYEKVGDQEISKDLTIEFRCVFIQSKVEGKEEYKIDEYQLKIERYKLSTSSFC